MKHIKLFQLLDDCDDFIIIDSRGIMRVRKYPFIIKETIGIGVINMRGIEKLRKVVQ
jgi:hypothetical protein